jgi:spore maturation protein CgeB
MKIALFTIKNPLACHYALFGYKETLKAMGHEVLECSLPSNQVSRVAGVEHPSIETLEGCDVIMSTYHEYVQPWLTVLYALGDWEALMKKVPVVARFDESMDRTDLALPERVPSLLKWATHYSWPAAQDAKKYGGNWLVYGADSTIFHRHAATHQLNAEDKPYPIGFVGTLYEKRKAYIDKLAPHVGRDISFYIGNVWVQDVPGLHEKDTFARLAMNYAKFKIFFCLPPKSNLIVEKVFDVMACDTMVMFPRLSGEAAENLKTFKDEEHIVYYDYGFFANNGKQIRYYLDHPEEIDRIAQAGGKYVRENHTLEQMMQALLDQAKT